MDSVTHRITAAGPDGTALEVLHGYADRGRRMLDATVRTVLACFAVAAAILVRAVSR